MKNTELIFNRCMKASVWQLSLRSPRTTLLFCKATFICCGGRVEARPEVWMLEALSEGVTGEFYFIYRKGESERGQGCVK